MDIHAYDAQADTISVDGIASDVRNRIILRRFQRNNADNANNDTLWIQNEVYDELGLDKECTEYLSRGSL